VRSGSAPSGAVGDFLLRRFQRREHREVFVLFFTNTGTSLFDQKHCESGPKCIVAMATQVDDWIVLACTAHGDHSVSKQSQRFVGFEQANLHPRENTPLRSYTISH